MEYQPESLPNPNVYRGSRVLAAVLLILSALVLVARWVSVFTESINWDEFMMLARVEQTLRTGELAGGSRPGLAAIILIPFVRDCTDAITTAVQARILWQFITLAYLCGVFFLVRNWFRFSRRPENGTAEGAAAVALLAFLPAFVAWSVQVRTDQAALAAAVWGGVCLLSDRRRLAVLSGVLFGLALLCTQKAVYTGALGGLLWITAILARVRPLALRSRNSELVARTYQALVVALGAAATLAIYAYLVPVSANLVAHGSVVSGWEDMQWVRTRMGYRAYMVEASQAPLHIVLLLGLTIASLRAVCGQTRWDCHLLGTSWAVLVLGVAVILFHGSSYPYFVMTAGLFPAVALGMASGGFAKLLGKRRQFVAALAFLLLVLGSTRITLEVLSGSQANQRDTMRWIRSSGLTAHRGYQVDAALICVGDPDPLPGLSHRINRGMVSEFEFIDLIEEFRRRPIAYIVDADRKVGFPPNVEKFWAEHYRWYYGSVSVAGFSIQPKPGANTIDVIVPGRYRWIPNRKQNEVALQVAGSVIKAGSSAPLPVGTHEFVTQPPGSAGVLVLDLRVPSDVNYYQFIDARQIDRLRAM